MPKVGEMATDLWSERADTLSAPDNQPARKSLVRAKLGVPAFPPHHIPRTRVSDKIARLLDLHGTVALSAIAGSGKTVAAIATAAYLGQAVAWLTVDSTDTAVDRFLVYLEAAVTKALPQVQSTASSSVTLGIAHAEAAAILAESIGDMRLTVVIDQLDRLPDEAEAWSVIESFLRYSPPSVHTILVSRRALPIQSPSGFELPVVTADDLALTTSEARLAVRRLNVPANELDTILEATEGWVTGVLLEAERFKAAGPRNGLPRTVSAYLATHVFAPLSREDRDFLISSSLLRVVTPDTARRLGLTGAGIHLASVRTANIPVEWSADGMRFHPHFREFLLDLLMQRDGRQLRDLRTRYGRVLLTQKRYEEAVDELLAGGAIHEAVSPAAHSIKAVIERHDFETADHWLDIFDPANKWVVPRLMLAVARNDFCTALRATERIDDAGGLIDLARSDEVAAVLLVWIFLHQARVSDIRRILTAIDEGDVSETIRYALRLYDDLPDEKDVHPPHDTVPGSPLNALMLFASYAHGRHQELLELSDSCWSSPDVSALRIATFRATGRVEQALELHDRAGALQPAMTWLSAFVGAELMIDAGRGTEAAQLAVAARRLASVSKCVSYRALSTLIEVKRLIMLEDDVGGARAMLDQIGTSGGRSIAWIREIAEMWEGAIALFDGHDRRAAQKLRAATSSMQRGGRLLELQSAAVYLAEAEWRNGDPSASDAAADLALSTATLQGSAHGLQRALVHFPSVAARRIDAEPQSDSPWHRVGRTIAIDRGSHGLHVQPTVLIREFGTPLIALNEELETPRLTKSLELLAFLSTQPERVATRDALIEALFDGRAAPSVHSYLRQAIHQVRQIVGTAVEMVVDKGSVRVGDVHSLMSESSIFETKIALASLMQGEARLRQLTEALALFEQGPYLAKARSSWADERRESLLRLALGAQLDCAELAFAEGRLDVARRHSAAVIALDPFREGAWRVQMRVAGALGDGDAVIHTFRACQDALAAIQMPVSRATKRLLDDLRS